MRLHYDSLAKPIRNIWDRLGKLPVDFVLLGGTALAVQWGHRVSYDLDIATSRVLCQG